VSTQYELFHKARSLKDRIRYGLMWFKYHNFVSNLLDKFDACTVVSEKESSLINEITKNKVKARVIPNGIDLDNYAGFYGDPIPDTLIYTGALSYQANFDAVNYFLSEVFPLILANNPNVKLYITGNVDPIKAEKLPKIQNVIMTGYLEDIRPKLAQSWISIVPLRIGGGTRLKILESLALGTPIVATSKGAEGLEFVNGKEILIADQPREYANCILSLLRDPLLRNNLSINGKNAVASRYDWSKIGKYLLGVLEEL
jgi:glycosyltransferase involved in cell wall biosynthesis